MWKKKHGSGRQNSDDSMSWRMRFACWITKASLRFVRRDLPLSASLLLVLSLHIPYPNNANPFHSFDLHRCVDQFCLIFQYETRNLYLKSVYVDLVPASRTASLIRRPAI